MKKIKFKKGDWCFCEFRLQQITNIEEDRITEVSDFMCRMYGYDISDRCFPLDLVIKGCSDKVYYLWEEFLELKNGLNYPYLHRELVRRWVEMCKNKDDKKKLKELYDDLDKFGKNIINGKRKLNLT